MLNNTTNSFRVNHISTKQTPPRCILIQKLRQQFLTNPSPRSNTKSSERSPKSKTPRLNLQTNYRYFQHEKILPSSLKLPNQSILYKKKRLKGKIAKLINKSLIMNEEDYLLQKEATSSLYINNPKQNDINDDDDSSSLRKYTNTKTRMNFTFQNNLLSKVTPVSRYEDHFQTPEECIYSNFTEKEIQMIVNDPQFFNLINTPFSKLHLFQTKTLSTLLTLEEEKKNKNLLQHYKSNKIRIDNNQLPKGNNYRSRKIPLTKLKKKHIIISQNKETSSLKCKYIGNEIPYSKSQHSSKIGYEEKIKLITAKKNEHDELKRMYLKSIRDNMNERKQNKQRNEMKYKEGQLIINSLLMKIKKNYSFKKLKS